MAVGLPKPTPPIAANWESSKQVLKIVGSETKSGQAIFSVLNFRHDHLSRPQLHTKVVQ
jgi:hypothetical protein